MPLSFSTERVFGMYLRSPFCMSSAMMKTMLGLAVSARASSGMLPERPKASSSTKATEANGKTIFLIPSTLLYRGGGKKGDQTPVPTCMIAHHTFGPSLAQYHSEESFPLGAGSPCSFA